MRRNRDALVIWVILAVIIIVAALVSEPFTNPRNFSNLAKQAAALALVSVGQTFALLIAGIDLSVGSTISLVVVVLAALMTPTPVSMLVCASLGLLIGLTVGTVNGLLITRLNLAPFMVTLATLSILQGLALQLRQQPQATLPREFGELLTGNILGVSTPLLLVLFVYISGILFLRFVPFGRYLYAVGSNESAARLSGLKTGQVKLLAYALCGFMAGAAGVFIAARSRAGDPLIGDNFAFDSITAVVLGGTSLFGGRGSLVGTLAGVIIITVLSNILNLLGVPSTYQFVLKGSLLILAVMFYRS